MSSSGFPPLALCQSTLQWTARVQRNDKISTPYKMATVLRIIKVEPVEEMEVHHGANDKMDC